MAENLLQMTNGKAHDNINGLMVDGYRGTLPLTMEMFPQVPSPQSVIDQGLAKKGDLSNILTGLEINPKDKKWYLFPTMIRGKQIDSYEDAQRRAFIGKHFGVYDSYDEGMKADKVIHDYFDRIKGYQSGGVVQNLYSMI